MKNAFEEMLKMINIYLTETQKIQFETYYKMLVSWNEKINLTTITQRDDVFVKHFYDSICLSKAYDFYDQSILDVGSGGGFPGIPLKIVFPNITLTIVDSQRKRIEFLEELGVSLKLDIELEHGRIEQHQKIQFYDVVTARAVAPLNILSELCLPFVKIGGYFLPMKAKQITQELSDSVNAIECLGGRLENVVYHDYLDNNRAIAKIRKISPSPTGYPRLAKKIKSSPL